MRALVTGANGHISANLVRELAVYDVVALVREGADLRGLEGVKATVARGDVRDEAAVARAAEGCELVFHCAAPYKTWARDEREIVEPAVRGTEVVLRAAKKEGARRAIVTSSCNVVGFTTGEPRDESMWRERAASPYMKAKLEQEKRARALGEELGLEVITVLPTTVLGPHDWKKTPTSAPFVDALRGKGPVPFAMNLVDVRDVAAGHRLAAEKGCAGERYLLGGDNVSAEEIQALIVKETGKKPPLGLPPLWILRAVAALAELGASVTGSPPPITRALIEDSGGGAPLFSIEKAKRELGYRPRGAAEVIAGAAEWARAQRWI